MFTSLFWFAVPRNCAMELLLFCCCGLLGAGAIWAWISWLAFWPNSLIFFSWYCLCVKSTSTCFLFLPTFVGFELVLSKCSVLPFFSGRWKQMVRGEMEQGTYGKGTASTRAGRPRTATSQWTPSSCLRPLLSCVVRWRGS